MNNLISSEYVYGIIDDKNTVSEWKHLEASSIPDALELLINNANAINTTAVYVLAINEKISEDIVSTTTILQYNYVNYDEII